MAKLETITKIQHSLDEGRDVASFSDANPKGETVKLTEYSAESDKGRGIQITVGLKYVQLNKKGATAIGKFLTKWALTQ